MRMLLVLYEGEKPVATGSAEEIAEKVGMKVGSIRKMSTPKYLERYEKSYAENPETKMFNVVKVLI